MGLLQSAEQRDSRPGTFRCSSMHNGLEWVVRSMRVDQREWWAAMECDMRTRGGDGGAGCLQYGCDPVPQAFLARRARNVVALGADLHDFWPDAVTLWRTCTRVLELDNSPFNLTARREQYVFASTTGTAMRAALRKPYHFRQQRDLFLELSW
jgi:hypothetical protein